MIDFGGTHILNEYDDSNELTVKTRRQLMALLANFLKASFKENLTKDIKIATAKAVVFLFPNALKSVTGEEYVRTHKNKIS